MDIPPDALGFVVVLASLLGTAFGVKLLVWGKGPIRRIRGGAEDPAAEERLAELEDRVRQLASLAHDQSRQLEDYQERLDFTERMLTQQRMEQSQALEPPADERP
ncbi:MAG: hypothetical protein PVF27_04390 [Gemmatimonadales bacterium]